MFLLRLCVSSSVRASQTHHGESDRHGATGRKEDLHGHEYTCFNPRADALIGATILGIVRHATDWEECREIWQEIRRRERLGIGGNAVFPRRHISFR
jgi:hypothetical protein